MADTPADSAFVRNTMRRRRSIGILVILLSVSTGCKERAPSGVPLNDQQVRTLTKLKTIGFKCEGDPIPMPDSSSPWLSPGGKGYAYLTRDASGASVVANGVTMGPYPVIDGQIVLSDDGSAVAFTVIRDRARPQLHTLIINGKEVATHENFGQIIAVCGNGERYANVIFQDLYIDGKDVGKFFRVAEVDFSPDGKNAIWIAAGRQPTEANRPGGYDVWCNGKKFPSHFRFCGADVDGTRVTSLAISPDGRRWAVRGQVFGPSTPRSGGIGGYAVIVDGRMQPTFGDVVPGTLRFSSDSQDVLYAAGDVASGNYAVYRNGKPGKAWNYIAPKSLQLIRGGKGVAFTGYQGPPGRFVAFNPVSGREPWSPGAPGLVIDDQVAVPKCFRWEVSEDGQHILAEQMENDTPINGTIIHSLLYDGKKVADVPEDSRAVELRLSPSGLHWLAAITDRFSQKPELVVDGATRLLPPEMNIHEIRIDDTGRAVMLASMGGSVWRGMIAPVKTP